MSAAATGGPAFPGAGPAHPQPAGMTLRDYFAAQALQSIISVEYAGQFTPQAWADHAYQMADAMIAERAT